jgi:hypothetical protein
MLPKKVIHAYIMGAINCEGYDLSPLPETDTEKLQHLANCFKSEYLFHDNLKRYGSYQNCFANWIMGLPSCFHIDFANHKILDIAVKWGSIPTNASEKQEDKILANWFNLIAANTLQLFSKHKINYYL